MSIKENVIGNKYGRLLVIEELPELTKYNRRVRCICDCGKELASSLGNLRSGHTVSCGCYRAEATVSRSVSHGMSKSGEYKSYHKMIERCYNKEQHYFHRYGGRGIKVCDRWLESFENFLSDMGNKPTPKHTLEREDNDRDYEPSNCSWQLSKEQQNNKENNVRYEYDGIVLTQAQWCEKLNINRGKLVRRLASGLSFSEIVELLKPDSQQQLK